MLSREQSGSHNAVEITMVIDPNNYMSIVSDKTKSSQGPKLSREKNGKELTDQVTAIEEAEVVLVFPQLNAHESTTVSSPTTRPVPASCFEDLTLVDTITSPTLPNCSQAESSSKTESTSRQENVVEDNNDISSSLPLFSGIKKLTLMNKDRLGPMFLPDLEPLLLIDNLRECKIDGTLFPCPKDFTKSIFTWKSDTFGTCTIEDMEITDLALEPVNLLSLINGLPLLKRLKLGYKAGSKMLVQPINKSIHAEIRNIHDYKVCLDGLFSAQLLALHLHVKVLGANDQSSQGLLIRRCYDRSDLQAFLHEEE